ncbi:MAG: hypothetical protein CFE23_09225 [Flavobacterium sp. BFFFF1]|uniref:hypothetical protein n=1 Tax=Flavobacterium sp. BFFFF1 TaxID=2015557 RepID=UPI000BD0DEF5|nr:hypothetical protein [Flavobacterium sp. BFFFF1]OYU80428.1 MAG: hypothetical protein CFE23_09225 [Flavobacterium sp. BFFFF1]
MKKLIIVLLGIGFLQGCEEVIDDFDKGCTSDCTTVNGVFVTAENVPLKGIKIEVDYNTHVDHSYSTRNIKKAVTDEQGFYDLTFFAKDTELGNGGPGTFRLQADFSVLDTTKYMVPDRVFMYGNFNLSRRDTVLSKAFYVPRKAVIKVSLHNFVPQQPGDKVVVSTFFPSGGKVDDGFLDTDYNTGAHTVAAKNVLNQTMDLFAAAGETNIVRVYRVKNGVSSQEEIQLFIGPGNPVQLDYDF